MYLLKRKKRVAGHVTKQEPPAFVLVGGEEGGAQGRRRAQALKADLHAAGGDVALKNIGALLALGKTGASAASEACEVAKQVARCLCTSVMHDARSDTHGMAPRNSVKSTRCAGSSASCARLEHEVRQPRHTRTLAAGECTDSMAASRCASFKSSRSHTDLQHRSAARASAQQRWRVAKLHAPDLAIVQLLHHSRVHVRKLQQGLRALARGAGAAAAPGDAGAAQRVSSQEQRGASQEAASTYAIGSACVKFWLYSSTDSAGRSQM